MTTVAIRYTTLAVDQSKLPYVIAFAVRSNGVESLYYLRYGNVVPELFDAQATRIRTANFDDWVQLQTAGRYSMRSVLDMAEAFAGGMLSAYSADDLKLCAEVASVTAIEEIFQTRLAAGYAAAYRIEISPVGELTKNIDLIRVNWDAILKKLGIQGLHNYLNRWYKYCHYFAPASKEIFERFLERIHMRPTEPAYPATSSLDVELRHRVVQRMLPTAGAFKGIPADIIKTAQKLTRQHDS